MYFSSLALHSTIVIFTSFFRLYKNLFISYESKKIRNDAKKSLSSNKHKRIIVLNYTIKGIEGD